jgi:hypothetical protein
MLVRTDAKVRRKFWHHTVPNGNIDGKYPTRHVEERMTRSWIADSCLGSLYKLKTSWVHLSIAIP